MPGSPTTSTVHVTGTLIGDCQPVSPGGEIEVIVDVRCASNSSQAKALPNSGGNWSVDIPVSCRCGDDFVVKAFCATDPNCTDDLAELLPCDCPTGTLDVSVGGCDDTGKRKVTLTANIMAVPAQPPGAPAKGQWNFGDGSLSGTFPLAVGPFVEPHPYTPPGPYTAQFIVLNPPGCPPLHAAVPRLDPCPANCPVIDAATATPGDCNPDGTRTVHFSATLSGGPALTSHWDFGDTHTAANPIVDHDYVAPGTYDAIFVVTGTNPACIATKLVPVNVESCIGDNHDHKCGWLLPIVGGLIVIATAFTIFMIALQTCPMLAHVPLPPTLSTTILWGVVIGLWIAVLASLAFWWLLCHFGICDCPTECDWAALAWMALLAGAVVAFDLRPCCVGDYGWVWWLLGIALAVASLASFYYWLTRCHPSRCEVVALLLLVFTSIIAVALSWFAVLPPIHACSSGLVEVTVALISAVLAGFAVGCQAGH